MKMDPIDGPSSKQSVCGGVVADEKRKLVVTAWHCVPNSQAAISAPDAFSFNGMRAKLVKISPQSDQAIFHVPELKGVKAPKFAIPQKGDIAVATAYYDAFQVSPILQDRFMPPMTINTVLEWEGKVAAVANAEKSEPPAFEKRIQTSFKWIVIAGQATKGFSGGPAFNKAGEFIGIVSNANGGFTNVSSSENTTELIKGIK